MVAFWGDKMTTFHVIQHDCPCCGEETDVSILTSTNTFGGQLSDFHTMAAGWPPLPLQMSTCETCGFSGYANDFTKPTLDEALKQRIRYEITPMIGQQALGAGRRYELYALIREMAGDDEWQMANHYMRATWAAFDERTSNQSTYREFALQFFLKAYDKGLIPNGDLPAITYLIGELYRRLDDTDHAAEWFNKVEEKAKSDPAWEKMAAIAVRQRDNPQERL